jgi:hypothetical protein
VETTTVDTMETEGVKDSDRCRNLGKADLTRRVGGEDGEGYQACPGREGVGEVAQGVRKGS